MSSSTAELLWETQPIPTEPRTTAPSRALRGRRRSHGEASLSQGRLAQTVQESLQWQQFGDRFSSSFSAFSEISDIPE